MNSEGSWSLWITIIKLPFNFPLCRIIKAIVATSPSWPPQCFIILVAILEAQVPGSSNGAWLNMLSKKPSFPSSTQIHHTLTHKPDLCVDKTWSCCSQFHWLVHVPASSASYKDSPLPASPFPLLSLWKEVGNEDFMHLTSSQISLTSDSQEVGPEQPSSLIYRVARFWSLCLLRRVIMLISSHPQ